MDRIAKLELDERRVFGKDFKNNRGSRAGDESRTGARDLQPERTGWRLFDAALLPEICTKFGRNAAHYAFRTESNDAVFPINTTLRVYAPRKMIRESYLFLPHLADSSDLLTLCAKKDTRGILFENFDYHIRGKEYVYLFERIVRFLAQAKTLFLIFWKDIWHQRY